MRALRDQPIRTRLIVMLTIITAVALLLASTFFYFHEKMSLEESMRSHATTMARVIGHNATAYLLFDDAGAARQDLTALGKDHTIIRAEIQDMKERTFAVYARKKARTEAVLTVDEPIMLEQRRIGRVILLMDMEPITHALEHTAWTVATIFLFSILVAIGLAAWMQRSISGSIAALSNQMKLVRKSGNYALRATKQSDDELGALTDGFNAMLEQIEMRDAELSENRRKLEQRVETRTRELKQTNRQLTEQIEERRLLASALEQAGEAIVITDCDGTIIYSNESFSRINGYTRDETLGQPLRMLKSDRHNSAFYRKLWNDLQKEGAWSGKVWNRRKNGDVYPAQLHLKAVCNTKGAITHYVGSYADIRHYASLEEQLAQAQKMEAIGTLVGGIAHDFNNMLGSISIYTHLAMEQIKDRPKPFEQLQMVAEVGQDATNMIKQLLTFARKESVQMELLSLTPLIRESINLTQASIRENIRLKVDLSAEMLMAEGNSTQIQQALVNLLNNARDAVEHAKDPEIHISCTTYVATPEFAAAHSTSPGIAYAWLTVSDNGHGIAREDIGSLFEPFFTTKEPGKGTGLGLAMVYGAVQSHGGIIEVESQQGRGSSFHIYLPLQERGSGGRQAPSTQPVCGHGETILIADDDPRIRRPLAEFLNALGYTVVVAEDGLQTVEMFDRHRTEIALMIIDAVMPGMSGTQAVAAIRSGAPRLPVIFGTGYEMELNNEALPDNPWTRVMDKPFDLTALSEDIRNMLE